jgi:hypothetical protein
LQGREFKPLKLWKNDYSDRKQDYGDGKFDPDETSGSNSHLSVTFAIAP